MASRDSSVGTSSSGPSLPKRVSVGRYVTYTMPPPRPPREFLGNVTLIFQADTNPLYVWEVGLLGGHQVWTWQLIRQGVTSLLRMIAFPLGSDRRQLWGLIEPVGLFQMGLGETSETPNGAG